MPRTRSSASFLFLILMIPAASPLSFNMSPITTSDAVSFNLSGFAQVDAGGLQITANASRRTRAGRATYKEALLLWDKASNTMADFSTHFSFAIDSNGSLDYADGMAFFLAPCNYTFKNRSTGERLGLGDSTDRFVAVEFDTFMNGDDPNFPGVEVDTQCPHVGININSMASVNFTRWRNDITRGYQNDAWISYDAVSTTLLVEFTGRNGTLIQRGSLTYKLDLRDYLPEYVVVGFSAATGLLFEAHNIRAWNFSSHQISIAPAPEKKKGSLLVLGLGAGLPVSIILGLSFAVFVMWKMKKKKKKGLGEKGHLSDSSMDNEFERGTGPRKFSFHELVLATNNFAEERKLGEGGFGGVYRGFLREIHVAVKRVSKDSKQGRREYAAEVKIISQLRHINLVQLIGWCHQKAELLLVYEFMPNKSLASHLYNANSVLTWEMRYRIAHGLASALVYLHEELAQYVVHRDIKASNIMLDADFNAKLGDFGLARLVDHDKNSHSTIPAGTIGYMAPEYLADWRASKETDIYSFGIVLLEIACGRRPVDHRCPQNQIVLVEWVWSLYGAGKLIDAADPKLDTTSESDASKIERLMVVGLWCAHPDSGQRPSIREVVQVLTSEDSLPSLPLAMPKPKYDCFEMVTPSSSSGAHYDYGGATATTTTSDSVLYAQCSNSSNLTTSSVCSSTSSFLPR